MTRGPFELLDELNRTDESERIEAKDSRSGAVGKSVYKTLSAFSNEPGLDGGYLLFGVSRNDGGVYEAVGVSAPDKLQTDLTSMCTEFNVSIRPRIRVEERGGVCLVSSFVPEAELAQKPVFRTSAGLPEGAFRRNGSADVRCAESDLQVLFAARDGSTFDASIVAGASITDLDPDAIASYREVMQRRDSGPDISELSNEGLLLGRHCIGETADEKLAPTVAGLVLFGTTEALRREMPMTARVDFIRVPGTRWADASREMETIVLREPLVRAIPRMVTEVVGSLPRRFTFASDSVQRTDEPIVPRRALREAIVNAVMHRDYRRQSSVQIIRYDDRIEVANPGCSLKPVDRFDVRGSNLRNSNIALVLYEMHFAETMGSGIGRIRGELKERGLPEPSFESSGFADEFVTVFPLGDSEEQDQSLSQDGKSDSSSAESDSSSAESDSSSAESDSSSAESDSSSTERAALLAELPAELRDKIVSLGSRVPSETLREAIVEICRHRAYRPSELGTLLDRRSFYLTEHYLTPLLQEGLLEQAHPDNPRHPRQAYRAIEEGDAGE